MVAKAWEQIDRINARATIGPRARARHRRRPDRPARRAARRASAATRSTCSTAPPTGRSRSSSRDLGATYHTTAVHGRRPARRTSSSRPRAPARSCSTRWPTTAPNGIVCLTGISSGGRAIELDAGDAEPHARARERRRLRLGQREPPPLRGGGRGARAAPTARWLERLITRRVPLDRWHEALDARAATTSRSSSSSAPPEPRLGTQLAELEACCPGSDGARRKELRLGVHSAQRFGGSGGLRSPRGRRENHVRKRLASLAALAAVAVLVPVAATDAATNDGSPNDPRAKAFVKEVSVDRVERHQQRLQQIATANGGTRDVFGTGYTASVDYVVARAARTRATTRRSRRSTSRSGRSRSCRSSTRSRRRR